MAQNDLIISNQSFPSFRTDLNNALQAINSSHSGSTTPSGAVAGTIWLDTTNATIPLLKYYDGVDNITLATINHSTNTVTFSGVSTDLVNDLTPQLGGDLDVQTNKVVTTANRNVKVYPNGTGVFEVGGSTNSGRIQLNCEQNTHGIKLASPAHSAGQNYTLTFPTTAPTANKVLQTDGSGNLSFASVSGGIEWQAVHTSATLTAVANYGYFLNTTSNAITVTLPASPVIGNQIALVDYAGTFDTNALTINPNGNKIEGATANLQLTGEREGVLLVFTDATQGWIATSGINEGTDAFSPAPYSIDFLVVAGGGGGGANDYSGGGGAGGYRTSTQSSLAGVTITVTVGDGGAGGVNNPNKGANGSNSSISGTGFTTITSTGGGGGSSYGTAGGNGGSGGGASTYVSPRPENSLPGSGNTPSTSPSQGNNGGAGAFGNARGGSDYSGGGGGGASAAGVAGTVSSTGGNGGAGTASSITGSSVSRGGGGGAGVSVGAAASGGTGGGGNGAGGGDSPAATAGTVNTGGGGGGVANVSTGAAGGKGVVILSLPTANYSSTTTGSPTVTTSGANTILQFNGSGSYTT